jgi:ubiquinone/menaquinone biosynthesis C-methylase UbiE
MRQLRERAVLQLLRRAEILPLESLRILDVGCGDGQWLADFETWGARRDRLAGIDLIGARVEQARNRFAERRDEKGVVIASGADLWTGDASTLPWESDRFDLVLQSMTFSSILDPGMRHAVAGEMARVLTPNGAILWYDFLVDNPRNPSVRGVGRAELAQLFPGFSFHGRRATVVPPVARRLAVVSLLAVEVLESLRILNGHALGLLRPRAAVD